MRCAVELAEPLTESPGETRTRLVLNTLHLGPVQPQVKIYDDAGLIGRVDFLLVKHRAVVEFDGLSKYGANNAQEAIIAEEVREDRLRALGYGIARVVWKDFDVAGRIEAKLRRAANATA